MAEPPGSDRRELRVRQRVHAQTHVVSDASRIRAVQSEFTEFTEFTRVLLLTHGGISAKRRWGRCRDASNFDVTRLTTKLKSRRLQSDKPSR